MKHRITTILALLAVTAIAATQTRATDRRAATEGIAFCHDTTTACPADDTTDTDDDTADTTAYSPDYTPEPKRPITLPGPGHINVENLRDIDLKTDISRLTLAELRVLRNAFAARQGYAFMSEDLRSLFSTTSWYDSLFYSRWERVEETYEQHPLQVGEDEDYRVAYVKRAAKYMPIRYTPEEQKFIARIAERERELATQNFKTRKGEIVNTANIINPWQIENMPETLRTALASNGFAIVPADGIQLFHIYEQNDYTVFPSFVTTDLYLQLFHFYFDCLLRDIEEQRLDSCVNALCCQLDADIRRFDKAAADKDIHASAEWLRAYLAVAQTLLSGHQPANIPAAYAQDVADEVARCTKAESTFSSFLGYDTTMFPYSLFRPRGHYTTNERLQRYFRAMMWLQTVTFATDKPREMHRALTLAAVLHDNQQTAETYRTIVEPLDFLLGLPDNVSIMQLAREITRLGLNARRMLTDKRLVRQLTKFADDTAEKQTRIRPKHLLTSRNKLNLMPQRYMPDAEVLQEMVDAQTEPTLRKAPKALDIMAALGSSAAERILIDELREAERWPQYPLQLDSMRRRMAAIDWSANVATRWIDALRTLPPAATAPSDKATLPYFMLTPAWQRKSLNTALASYAELKHDAILYGKQPFAAECGGAGPPEPVNKGYVEPSIDFWRKAVELNKAYYRVLESYDLLTDKASAAAESIGTLAEFLLSASERELAGQTLTDNDYEQIEIIGSTVENIALALAQGRDQYFTSWEDVQGADRNMACIADVYTANALNTPDDQKAVIYEAVGPAYEIYVIVEIEGRLWLTRGGVFSYRELERPVAAPRLNDEEWQQQLQTNPDEGIPSWMQDIIVPLDNRPKPNAEIFYSSGC